MLYPEPYLPSEESIQTQMEEIKQQRIQKMQSNKPSKGGKGSYQRQVTSVPRDTRPIVGTNYQ